MVEESTAPNPPPSDFNTVEGDVSFLTSSEMLRVYPLLSFALIVFTVIIINNKKLSENPEFNLQLIVIIFSIVSVLYIVTIGFDAIQVNAAIGVIGAIIGFVLGGRNSKDS